MAEGRQPAGTPQPGRPAAGRGRFVWLSRWWNRGPRQKVMIIAAIPLLFMCGCCTIGVALSASPLGPQLGLTAPPTATTPPTSTPLPTLVRSPTATPLPSISLTSPILGGSGQAFYTLYGQNSCCYKNGWNYQGPYGATWTGIWGADGPTTYPTPEGNGRVTGLQTSPNDNPWTVTQALAMAKRYMPPDAKLLRTKTFSGPDGKELVYSSALLKATLPAADFKGTNGNQAQPGVFYVFLDYTYNGSPTPLVDWCNLGTDESLALTY